ncbi:solute carrier organic anion transporter family member 4C1-like [Haemaphysalis longicornis]
MLASGLVGFATKIFISMFGISPTKASTLLGAVSVPSACGGTLLGGYVITKLSVRSSTIMRYCTILSIVPWFTLFVFTHSCETSHAALANYTTTDVTALKITFGDLEHSCNAHCNCSGAVYDPVCGTDNFTYYSPCIAGCSNVERVHRTKYYSHCTCVHGPTSTVQLEGGGSFSYMAQRDPCVTDCGLVVVYAAAMFVALFFTFLLIVPALTAMLRSLDEDIKSTGIGVNYVAVRLFGTIPGPMIFGYLIDRSCAIWKMSCSGSSGACAGGQEIEPPVELSVNSELTNDAVPAAPAEGAQTVEPGPVGSGNAGGAEVAEPDIAETGKAEATGKAKATGVAKRDEDVPDGHAAKEPAVEKG